MTNHSVQNQTNSIFGHTQKSRRSADLPRKAIGSYLLMGVVLVVTVMTIAGCAEETPELMFDQEYGDWEKTVAQPLTYPIPGHGERRRAIFINEIGIRVERTTDAAGVGSYDYPDGTIVVKENYTDVEGTAIQNFTIMIKAREDSRAQKGWVWINKDAKTGEETIFSDSDFCLTCHDGANQSHPYGDGNPSNEFRDFLFFPYIPSEG